MNQSDCGHVSDVRNRRLSHVQAHFSETCILGRKSLSHSVFFVMAFELAFE